MNATIIWMEANGNGMEVYEKQSLLADAFDAIRKLAHEAKFLMGQVVNADGLVLANCAPGGALKLN